ncbi:PSD1 and planctomycete cytochrome C domain-containing protein [Paludisphaera mucosa]|uniref:PSD1 and planctomycete cytochrome C domain-containing protein n=1 Tax=Paludisphaera mucosa TaxID=3030827 RepID=A0ABT6F7N0_9BACT|nr:PSD1 and planctomycete cytochrome C domain-containing protein [Paludisphaera mucosa]MDG3003542.1 PSD1 and planctomycete cytochrome C domain-containing protein [Paludisphaera mucosa]
MADVRRRIATALLTAWAVAAVQAGEPPSFEKDVRPIFKAYCFDCHGGEALKGKLDLRLKRSAAKGGTSGPALVVGNPDESYLLARIQDGEMPPGEKKVPADRIAVIAAWIAAGAPTLREEPESLPPGPVITAEDRAHWAFQPMRKPTPPAVEGGHARTPIDAFALAKLREKGLDLAPDADRRTLIRRVSFDLAGLPPSWEDTQAFVDDPREDAYERLVDRLLASPQYGERWGRHWLDVAGYADSDGDGSSDTLRPYAYKYRDYVIRSLNADKPLDRFLVEQLAGDELVQRSDGVSPEEIETLSATGFLRMVADGTSNGGGDLPMASNQLVADAMKVVGSTLYGLTIGCAQCHDHRYDPITHEDYYRLRAVFEPALDPAHWRRPGERLVSLYTDADRAKAAAVDAEATILQKTVDEKTAKFLAAALEVELKKFPDPMQVKLREALNAAADKRTEEQKTLLANNPSLSISAGVLYQYNAQAAEELKKDNEGVAAKRAEKPAEDFVAVLDEKPGVRPETRVFHRGDYRQATKLVTPGDLTIASPDGARFEAGDADPKAPSSGRRLAFARHLTDGKHPLLARALANRFWMHHFGRGIVDTPGDFGALGGKPTNPELLDWLASELVDSGWSLKRFHRLILTSTVYRQSSLRDSVRDRLDGDSALLSRFPVRRLEAESLRDAILQVSGRLDRTLYGPSVGVVEDAVGLVNALGDSARRSIYLQVRRSRPVSFLTTFDAPVMAVNCDRRIDATSAPQALMLMNGDFVMKHAELLAARCLAESPGDDAAASDRRVAAAWRAAYLRPPSDEELAWAREFLVAQRAAVARNPVVKEAERAVLADLCQQLFNSNEFLYVD